MVKGYNSQSLPSTSLTVTMWAMSTRSTPRPRDAPPLAMMLRPRANMSQLAREAGVSTSYVSRVCSGEAPGSRRLREAAVRLLGLPEDVLFGARPSAEESTES